MDGQPVRLHLCQQLARPVAVLHVPHPRAHLLHGTHARRHALRRRHHHDDRPGVAVREEPQPHRPHVLLRQGPPPRHGPGPPRPDPGHVLRHRPDHHPLRRPRHRPRPHPRGVLHPHGLRCLVGCHRPRHPGQGHEGHRRVGRHQRRGRNPPDRPGSLLVQHHLLLLRHRSVCCHGPQARHSAPVHPPSGPVLLKCVPWNKNGRMG
mmetsp:Transcript_34210/g.100701  ORF Transcript_34210/g.100701 Transcript_34210/m.100701 type:complete len:206 (-) Transcript_34210:209-826(-)